MPFHRVLVTALGLTCLLSGCEPMADPGEALDSPAEDELPPDAAVPMSDDDFVEKAVSVGAVSYHVGETMNVEQSTRILNGFVPPKELTYDSAQEAVLIHSQRKVELLAGRGPSDWQTRLDVGDSRIRRKGIYTEQDYRSSYEGMSFLVYMQDGRLHIDHEDGRPTEGEEYGLVRRVSELARVGHDLEPVVDRTLEPGQAIPFSPDRQYVLKAILDTEQTLDGVATFRGVAERDGIELAVLDLHIEEIEGKSNLSTEMPLDGRAWVEVESGRLRELMLRGTKSAPAFSQEDAESRHFLYETHAIWTYGE